MIKYTLMFLLAAVPAQAIPISQEELKNAEAYLSYLPDDAERISYNFGVYSVGYENCNIEIEDKSRIRDILHESYYRVMEKKLGINPRNFLKITEAAMTYGYDQYNNDPESVCNFTYDTYMKFSFF